MGWDWKPAYPSEPADRRVTVGREGKHDRRRVGAGFNLRLP